MILYNGQYPITYDKIIDNKILINEYLKDIFGYFETYGAEISFNFINVKLRFINNINIYNIFNQEFNDDITNSNIIGTLIDIVGEYYDILSDINFININFKDIKAEQFDEHNDTNRTKTFKEILLSNLKFSSKYIQKKCNDYNISGGNFIIENWDQFYYIFNHYIAATYENNILFYQTTNEIRNGFYSTIKYLLEVENLNPQEGFDKYIENVSTMDTTHEIMFSSTIRTIDLRTTYRDIIKLFKMFDVIPKLDPIFMKISNNYDDNNLITIDVNPIIDDLTYYFDDIYIYQNRALLLDAILYNYRIDTIEWLKINDNVLSVFNTKIYDYKSIANIIRNYHALDIVKVLNKYADWNNIIAKQLPASNLLPNQQLTYKEARFMRLKFYSRFLKQYFPNINDD